MLSKLAQAKAIQEKYRPLVREQSIKATQGDKDASIKFLELLTEEARQIKALGYRYAGKDGEPKYLVRRTKKWALEQRAKHKESICGSWLPEDCRAFAEETWKKLEKEIYGNNL